MKWIDRSGASRKNNRSVPARCKSARPPPFSCWRERRANERRADPGGYWCRIPSGFARDICEGGAKRFRSQKFPCNSSSVMRVQTRQRTVTVGLPETQGLRPGLCNDRFRLKIAIKNRATRKTWARRQILCHPAVRVCPWCGVFAAPVKSPAKSITGTPWHLPLLCPGKHTLKPRESRNPQKQVGASVPPTASALLRAGFAALCAVLGG